MDVDLLSTDSAAPLLTYCDDTTGERTVLSPADLGAWTARTANLLVDVCGLGPGSRAAVLLPPHWQTAAVLLGAWSVGVSVSFEGAATAGLPRTEMVAVGPDFSRIVDKTRWHLAQRHGERQQPGRVPVAGGPGGRPRGPLRRREQGFHRLRFVADVHRQPGRRGAEQHRRGLPVRRQQHAGPVARSQPGAVDQQVRRL